MAPTEPPGTSRRRDSVQGLRALAVALVVIHHFFPDWLPGGYVGVDVFFVLSGYLVLGSVLRTTAAGGRVPWKDFYYRRAKRILPSAAVTVSVTLLLYALVLDPLMARRYASDALASLGFVANFRMRVEVGGYFSVFDPSPFRHFWTLGTEEQFYLLLPLAALLVAPVVVRWGRHGLLLGLAGGVGGTFLASTIVASAHPSAAFFMLPTRGWEFLVGGAAALLPTLKNRWVPAVGIAGIGLSTAVLTPTSLIPGPWLLPAVLATAVILASSDRDLVSRGLGTAPMRWLGDRSYSIYLVHWPLAGWLFFSTSGEGSTVGWHALGVAAAVAAGHLLFVLIESPLHRGWIARRGPMAVLPVTGALLAAALAASVVVPLMVELSTDREIPPLTPTQVLAGPFPPETVVPSNIEPPLDDALRLNALYEGCHAQLSGAVPIPCTFDGSWNAVDVVVMGDSHAAHWFDAVQEAAARGVTTAFLTHTSCPLFALGGEESQACTEWRSAALDMVRQAAPRLIILSNYTSGYGPGSSPEAVERGWADTLEVLAGLPVTVLGDVPTPPEDVARCLARNLDEARNCAFTPSADERLLDLVEREAVERGGARWIDTWAWLCADRCSVLGGNILLWRDTSGHLTPEGSALLAPRLQELLRRPAGRVRINCRC